MKTWKSLGLALLTTSAIVACGSAGESDTSSTDDVRERKDPNVCFDKCVEQTSMPASTTPSEEVAKNIGTFTLSTSDGIHPSTICELTLEARSTYDNALKADRLTDRRYRLTRCGTGIEERGTYRVILGSYFRYIEFKSDEGAVQNFGLDTTVTGDLQIQNWYYPEEELKRAAAERRQPSKAEADRWTFLRTGDFWCESVSNCEGQYLGCFVRTTSPKGGGVKCENGPPWACVGNVCKGVAQK